MLLDEQYTGVTALRQVGDRRSISATTDGWMPSVGSSRIRHFGDVINALAIASCCRCPPDSRPARRVNSSVRAGNRSSCSSISCLTFLRPSATT